MVFDFWFLVSGFRALDLAETPNQKPKTTSQKPGTMNHKPSPLRWLVLAGAFAILFFVQGSRSIIGVAFKPIVEEFGWARGSFSLVLSVHMAIFALMLPIVGRYFDRYGAKWVIIASSLCLTVGYLGIAAAQSLWLFLLLYGLFAAIGFGGCSITLFGAVASKWFRRHRGMASFGLGL